MKKLLLTITAVLTILFAQAQCQAYFSYMQNGPTTVFTDLSTMQSTNYSATWSWDFGDGTTSTQQNPIHTYSNGIYSPCLTVTYFDSTIINWCTSVYCDSILVGNGPAASWDCTPAIGCYDPGTGLGQYTTLASCQSNCGNVSDSFACMGGINPGVTSCVGPGVYTMGQTYVTAVYSTMAACISDSCNVISPPASWDCAPNTPAGCYDPGTGLGQYTTLTACQAVCGTPTPSWDCSPANGCYDPGTGNGQYTTLSACQSACSSVSSSPCDSMTVTGSQYAFTAEVNNINTIIEYWSTTLNNGLTIAEDSMTNTHYVQYGTALDTVVICIDYYDPVFGYYTCCVIWIWDANSGVWAKMGSVTSIGEINSSNKKIIKVVDVLGRETSINSNQTLFFIYEDGTIEKKISLE